MSHPKELLELIAHKVRETYPESSYLYEFERRIPGIQRVMIPDIWVRDSRGVVVCIVEIGYTRPEKLAAYRKILKVGDVRWYDKRGNLHVDILEVAVVRKEVIRPSDQLTFRVLPVSGLICYQCADEILHEITNHKRGRNFVEGDYPENVLSSAGSATYGDIIWNGKRVGILATCEECGRYWLESDPLEISSCVASEDDFECRWSALRNRPMDPIERMLRESISLSTEPIVTDLDGVTAYAKQVYELDLDYSDLLEKGEAWG